MGRNKITGICLTLISLLLSSHLYAEVEASVPQEQKAPEYAGEFFGVPVPLENYYFIKSALMVFGKNGNPLPEDAKQAEEMVWDELLLSFAAFQNNIEVSEEELDKEIARILEPEKVSFDWKNNREAFEKWTKERVNEPPELFRNQVRYVIQTEKLRRKIIDSITPEVSEEEAHQEFLNEHNALSVELAEFAQEKEAQDFYSQSRANADFWAQEKDKRLKEFRRPGLVSLEFLMDIWQFPKDAAYKMMQMNKGDIYPPVPIYKGYGVFQILDKRPANEAEFAKLKDSYYEQIRQRKKMSGWGEWFKGLKQQANIKIYKATEGG